MNDKCKFPHRVQALYACGKADIDKPWSNYIEEYLFTEDDIPGLIHLIKSSNLKNISPISEIEEFAPMHAWRVLGQLNASVVTKDLLEILTEEKNEEAFWFQIELPKVIGCFGADAIPVIKEFLLKTSGWDYKSIVLDGLKNIALNNKENKNFIVEIYTEILKNYLTNDTAYNACLIKELIDLNAIEVSNLIKEVLSKDQIDFDFISKSEIEFFLDR